MPVLRPILSCPEHGFNLHRDTSQIYALFGGEGETIDPMVINLAPPEIEVLHIDWNYNERLMVGFAKVPIGYCLAYIGVDGFDDSIMNADCYEMTGFFDWSPDNAFALFTEGGAVFESDRSHALYRLNESPTRRLGDTEDAARSMWSLGGDSSNGERRLNAVTSTNGWSPFISDFAFHPMSTDPENAIAFAIDWSGNLIRVVADFMYRSVVDTDIGAIPMPASMEFGPEDSKQFSSVWFGSGNDTFYATAPDGTVIRWNIPLDTVDVATVSPGLVAFEDKFAASSDGSTCFVHGSSTEEPVTATMTTEAPITETPTLKAPTTETPTLKAPTTETPITETPTTETPITETPTTEAPTTEAPITETPTTDTNDCVDLPNAPCDFLVCSPWLCQYGIYCNHGSEYNQMYWSTLCPEFCAATFPEIGDACHIAGLH